MISFRQNEYNAITEFKNNLKSSDIKIWIYILPVKDLNKKHNENYDVTQHLKRNNKENTIIEFNENLIGSFKEIKEWGEIKYINYEHRSINSSVLSERRLLERLLLQEIRNSVGKSIYEFNNREKSSIYIKKPLLNKDNVILKRKINFDINIQQDESIIVGFNLSHGYDYIM